MTIGSFSLFPLIQVKFLYISLIRAYVTMVQAEVTWNLYILV